MGPVRIERTTAARRLLLALRRLATGAEATAALDPRNRWRHWLVDLVPNAAILALVSKQIVKFTGNYLLNRGKHDKMIRILDRECPK